MRIFFFPTAVNILLDIVAWAIIHTAMSNICYKLSDSFFNEDKGIYKTKKWENQGKIYEQVFKIKRWKNKLPDGDSILRTGFPKKNLSNRTPDYLQRFVLETRRAELAHWLQIAAVPIFFVWNEWWVVLIMFLYALSVNIPCIMAQRYNRPRLMKYLNSNSA